MADPELSVGLREVPRNRFATEVERPGDLLGAKTRGGQAQHARLGVGEPPFSHGQDNASRR